MQRVVEECVDCMPDLVAYDENRNDLYNGLTGMGYECAKPDGAFYLFMKAPNGDDMAFSEAAKLEENILIVPGTGFGCPGYLRLAYCVSNETIKNSMPGLPIKYYRNNPKGLCTQMHRPFFFKLIPLIMQVFPLQQVFRLRSGPLLPF